MIIPTPYFSVRISLLGWVRRRNEEGPLARFLETYTSQVRLGRREGTQKKSSLFNNARTQCDPSLTIIFSLSLSLSLSLSRSSLSCPRPFISSTTRRINYRTYDPFPSLSFIRFMEQQSFTNFGTPTAKLVIGGGSSSQKKSELFDLNMLPSTSDGSSREKRKRNQVVPHDVIEIDGDEDQAGVVINVEKEESKNKATMANANHWQKQIKDALAKDLLDCGKDIELLDPAPSALKAFGSVSKELAYLEKFHDDYVDYYSDDDYMYSHDDNDDLDDNYEEMYLDNIDDLTLSAKFDAVDLPPGAEASFPWLQNLEVSLHKAGPSSSSAPSHMSFSNQDTSHSTNLGQLDLSKRQEEKQEISEAERKFIFFKKFDTVRDFSDHHYARSNVSSGSSFHGGKNWSKTIQNEWKLLEEDLPDTIYVRIYEERIDLLRAVILGAAGTPYHDGLFFFDIFFPSNYPSVPPSVYYHSGGLRLNPNLYCCGKVCLSLLNTWSGSKSEMWTPGKSTMLQVLLSIQALVLNAKPYFNEPGYASSAGRPEGERRSRNYNENTFILSCKTMMYTLRRPPKHFEEFVIGFFRLRAHAILEACKAYMEGAQVGCLVAGGIQDIDEGDKSCSAKFKAEVGHICPLLITAFTNNGSDCKKFFNLNPKSFQVNASSNMCTAAKYSS